MEKKGTLLVLDGLDGSGKTTQLERLERRLAREGIPARIISFPDYSQPSSSLVTMYLRGGVWQPAGGCERLCRFFLLCGGPVRQL